MKPRTTQRATHKNESPESLAADAGDSGTQVRKQSVLGQETKEMRILRAFTGGRCWTWQIARYIGTSCLHSDVSGLQSKYGLVIDRTRVDLPGFNGGKSWGHRYQLRQSPENLRLARKVLGLPEEER